MRYGLFIHYGLYSLLEGYWEDQETTFYAEWIQHTLSIKKEDYRRLTERFSPSAFDADQLVEDAISLGFSYLVLTAKHHDGFSLFDTKVSDYNARLACGRDLIKELSIACEKRNFPLGLYYSQAQDWYHGGYFAYQPRPEGFEEYFKTICLPQVEELLTNYGKIELLWFDTPMDMKEEEIRELHGLVKRLQPSCQISGRIGRNYGDYLVTGDNMLPSQYHPPVWEVPMTLSTSWGYRRGDQWKSLEDLLQTISKVMLRGGRVLLNIGPKGDFSIPFEATDRLQKLAAPIKHLLDLLKKEEVHYPYDDPSLLLFKDGKILYVLLLDERKRMGLYNLLSKVEKVYLGEEEIPFVQTESLEGDPYLGISLPQQGPLMLKIHCAEEISFLPFGHALDKK